MLLTKIKHLTAVVAAVVGLTLGAGVLHDALVNAQGSPCCAAGSELMFQSRVFHGIF
jgi:hypothetical protein